MRLSFMSQALSQNKFTQKLGLSVQVVCPNLVFFLKSRFRRLCAALKNGQTSSYVCKADSWDCVLLWRMAKPRPMSVKPIPETVCCFEELPNLVLCLKSRFRRLCAASKNGQTMSFVCKADSGDCVLLWRMVKPRPMSVKPIPETVCCSEKWSNCE